MKAETIRISATGHEYAPARHPLPKAHSKRLKSYRHIRSILWGLGQRACFYCSCRLTMTRDQPDSATVEHMTPLSRGGHNTRENMTLCCAVCNAAKGNMTLAEFNEQLSAPFIGALPEAPAASEEGHG